MAYRSDDYLRAALDHLGGELDVVIVDNDASPATARLASSFGARYVAAPRNLGFAAGVNMGLREAWDGMRDVLLLNPDARVRSRDVFALQQALHAHSQLGAVGPRLVDDQQRSRRAEWPLPSPAQVWFDALALGRFWCGRRFLVGAVLLLRAEALAQVGEFDERYFLYAEEADWQLRAQRLGWEVRIVDSITATHAGGASSNEATVRERQFYTSGAAFADRWYGRLGGLVMRLGSIVAAARRAVVGPSRSRALNRRVLQVYLKGGLHETGARSRDGVR